MSQTDSSEGADARPDEPDGADDAAAAPEASDLPKPWAERRRGMDPQNRRRVIDACAVRTAPGWTTHFVLMMVLSLLVAIMGLSQNSAALVIGAMLLAPLMQPVLGAAASLTMALRQPLRRSLLVLLLASAGSVLLAFIVASILRDGPLTSEVLSRTSPDARDLVVALAAGAAGAYATTRSDLSASLPGVAIAVALIPPLGVVGMTLEAGRGDLARGALLLYVTNLVAIVLASVVVFVLTGFVPPRRLATTATQVLLGSALALTVTIAVAIPLTIASSRAAADARDRGEVQAAAEAWVAGTGDEVVGVDVDGDHVTVNILGLGQPRQYDDLETAITQRLGNQTSVDVRWTQVLLAPRSTNPTDQELLQADVAAVVDQWLAAAGAGEFEVTSLDVGNSQVRLEVTSIQPPPRVEDLQARLDDSIGRVPELEVIWSPRTRIVPEEPSDGIDELVSTVRRVAQDWALGFADLEVRNVFYDGSGVVVDLVGPEPPPAADLEALIGGSPAAEVSVAIWYTQRQQLIPAPPPTATPTPAPTATPIPTATPTPTPTPVFDISFEQPAATPSG